MKITAITNSISGRAEIVDLLGVAAFDSETNSTVYWCNYNGRLAICYVGDADGDGLQANVDMAIGVNFYFEDRESQVDFNALFEQAMTELGRRPDKLPKN